jgi:hypothetical protein
MWYSAAMSPAQTNFSIISGFDVLQEVISSGRPMGSRELARRLEMEHSRANRILGTLVAADILQQNQESKYLPGPRVHVLSALSLHASGLVPAALPTLEFFHAMGATVALGTVWRDLVVYLLHARPEVNIAESAATHGSVPRNKSIIGAVLGPEAPATAYEDRAAKRERAWGARIGDNRSAVALAVVLPIDHPRAQPAEDLLREVGKAADEITRRQSAIIQNRFFDSISQLETTAASRTEKA